MKSNESKPEKVPNGTPFSPGRKTRGHAAVELALMAPWIFLLFAMVFNLGFYAYATIATENAARSASMYMSKSAIAIGSSSLSDTLCKVALNEMRGLPNVSANITTCPNDAALITDANPVAVVSTYLAGGIDGRPASRVAVSYRSIPMFLIPGLTNRLSITRFVESPIRED